jgi:DNA replication ATP-dependent helicase Dna2
VPPKRADSTPTPPTRLVWQDLMGETKTPQNEDDDEAPAEQLLWHNQRDEVSQRISPMIGRRKRKRARSSSPASSPSNAMPTTPAVNLKELSQAFKTPNADPTLQLWDRFTLPGGKGASPSGLTNPLMSHLFVSSSPRPPSEGAGPSQQQTESGLRRAISCGTQWPKRRKIFQNGPDANVTSQGSPNGNSKSSMVSALLKTVTGELNKSISFDTFDEPSKSPSPQKKRNDSRRDSSCDSPNKRATAPNKATNSRPSTHFDAGDSAEETRGAGTSSSDYGDDDFDEDTLLELDATVYTIPDEEQTKDVAANDAVMLNEENEDTTTVDEDFGDFDDDLLDAAEDIMIKAASQHTFNAENTRQHSHLSPEHPENISKEDEEDDPYSDDLGDIDFDAVELAATQSASRTGSSFPDVRTDRP